MDKINKISPLFIAIWVCVVLRIVAGNPILDSIFNYTTPGGLFIEKLHPSMFLVLLILPFLIVSGKCKAIIDVARAEIKAVYIFLIATSVIALIFIIFRGTSGLAYLADTHIFAAVIGIFVFSCSIIEKQKIRNAILIIVFVNSLIAVAEFAMNVHMIGYPESSIMMTFRSAALFGHPLNNALITIPATFFVYTTNWRMYIKNSFSFIYFLAVLCYGARAAFIIGIISIFFFMFLSFFKDFNVKRKYLTVSISIFSFPLIYVFTVIIYQEMEIGARIFNNDLFDISGMARLSLFSIFSYVSQDQLFYGMGASEVAKLAVTTLDLRVIENFWVLFFLTLGVPVGVILSILIIKLMLSLSARQSAENRLGAITFLLIATSNNSLATKTSALTVIVVLLIASFNKQSELIKS